MRENFASKIIGFIIRLFVFFLAISFLIPVILTLKESVYYEGKLTLEGYYQLILNCFPVYRMFWNSVIYSISITLGAILISVPAAFSFKFAQFKGKQALFVLYLVLMMMPLQVMILPNYIGLRDLGILNTPFGIIIPLIFSPFAVIVTHQYMKEIDVSIIEAARLDTNSTITIILRCVYPQIRVCIAAVALFLYADMWNMVEQPLLFLNDNKYRTLSSFIENIEYYDKAVLMPASVLFIIPVFLWYLLFHEELKEGLKLG